MAASSVPQDATKRRIENALAAFDSKKARPNANIGASGTNGSLYKAGYLEASETDSGGPDIGKFRPWSREDLLARISTYKIHMWLVQSPSLSPVVCARNGWINCECSMLKCPICKATIIAQIPDDLTEAEESQWIGQLSKQLQLSHTSKCPWRGRECAEWIYSLPLATSRETVDSICQFAADLLPFGDKLPETKSPLSTFQRGLLSDLKHRVFETQSPLIADVSNRDVDKDSGHLVQRQSETSNQCVFSALVLSLFGWRLGKSIAEPTVRCEMCFRSVGLWLFQSIASQQEEESGENQRIEPKDPQGDKRNENLGNNAKGEGLSSFDVAGEHRSFCCWINSSKHDSGAPDTNFLSQSASATDAMIPGWQKIISSILRAKAISSAEDVVSSSDDSGDEVSDSDESEGSGFEKGDQISRSRKPGNSQQNAEVDVLKRFKPFNISAISSAAEAFGIQFSTSLLTKAAKQLELYKTGNQHNANEMPSLQGAEADLCSSSVELGLQSDTASESHDLHQPDVSTRPDASKVSATAATLSESNIGNLEDDIPPPIDISGLAALLGDSTLASALEDPSKAQMILEYVKGLLKAKNQQGDGNAAQHKIG